MNPKISPEQSLKIVMFHINKANELLKQSYMEGTEEKKQLEIRIIGFIQAAFKDDDKKIAHFSNPYSRTLITEKEKQDHYISEINRMKYNLLAYKDELELILISKDDVEKETSNISQSSVTQHFHGNIDKFALGDINNYEINATIYLNALEKVIKEDASIPLDEKKTLIDKISYIAGNEYIASIGSGLIVEALKRLLLGK